MERIKRTEESQSESCRQSAQRFNLISFILGLEVFFSLDLTFSRLESLSGGRCSQSVQQKYPETNGGDAFPGNGKAFVRYIISATFRYTRNDTIHISIQMQRCHTYLDLSFIQNTSPFLIGLNYLTANSSQLASTKFRRGVRYPKMKSLLQGNCHKKGRQPRGLEDFHSF